jgi:hypothetical protein
MVVYGRPLAGTALFARGVAPRLAARRSRPRRALIRALAGPLPALLARGDAAMMRLLDPA